MEDKSMKCTNLTVLVGSFLFLFSLPSAGEKAVKENHFLSINSNIKNEKLNAELEILMRDFDAEKQKIQDYYTKEIERLKEERRSEEKALKKQFTGQKETLLKKYGEDRTVKHSKSDQINLPDKKVGKIKKPIRKPK